MTSIPWYLWCSALAVTSAYVGGYWDISWHRSIGRDSFWSPPHMAIYACGVLAGLSSAYLIFTTTFGARAPLRAVSVRIWGLRGTARRLHLGLGRARHARVGAVRRLVAQRLRPRRPHHQPAAHGARRRVLRHQFRHRDADARLREPRGRRRTACRCSGCCCTSAAWPSASRCSSSSSTSAAPRCTARTSTPSRSSARSGS